MRRHPRVILAAAVCLGAAGEAAAETTVSLYGGTSFTRRSDLHVTQAGTGSDATFRGVRWEARPLDAAPYYGLKLDHFLEASPQWGVALDFTHYKIYADTGRTVGVSGRWNGAPVDASAPLSQRVQRLDVSHGVNMLALNVLYRWMHQAGGAHPRGRLQPYVGAGLALYVLHPESTVNGRGHVGDYQGSGAGVQLLAGVRYGVTPRLGVFAETKFNTGTARVDIAGGEARTRLRSLHAIAGASWSF